ncbi:MAG: 2,5-diamino-6-(ribosylamino)-4(3H)-pyrimidinone 5'-phosphate reductase [Candidatus Hodarchaeales archaeon]
MNDSDEYPKVILNCAMSLDGKIATKTGNAELSNREDWCLSHQLRNSVDGIMVGINTILKDDSKLTVKEKFVTEGIINHPIRIVVDSRARIPLSSSVIQHMKKVKTIVAVSTLASEKKIQMLSEEGVTVYRSGAESVDLKKLCKYLKKNHSVNTLMLEGGGTLNWSMLRDELIDEIWVFIAPVIASGCDSVPIFNGKGFEKMNDGPLLRLKSSEKLGDGVKVKYVVDYDSTRRVEV